jgi:hypothetical protein
MTRVATLHQQRLGGVGDTSDLPRPGEASCSHPVVPLLRVRVFR